MKTKERPGLVLGRKIEIGRVHSHAPRALMRTRNGHNNTHNNGRIPANKTSLQNFTEGRQVAGKTFQTQPDCRIVGQSSSGQGVANLSPVSFSRTRRIKIKKLKREVQTNNRLPNQVCEDDRFKMWLRYYSPFCGLQSGTAGSLLTKGLSECVRYVEMRVLPKGTVLFNPGESDHVVYYLLYGQVRIKKPIPISGSHFEIISSITPGHYTQSIGGDTMPRTVHAQVIRRSAFLCIDQENPQMLDSLQQLIQHADCTTHQEIDDTKWMEKLLSQRWLKLVDGKFIQRLFSVAEQVNVKAGEVLQEHGKRIEYVYIISKGSCFQLAGGKPMSMLTALSMTDSYGGKARTGQKNIRLLGSGACLGDVQAISLAGDHIIKPSPYTAQMQTSGLVLRICRTEFNKEFGHYVLDWLVNRYNWSQERSA